MDDLLKRFKPVDMFLISSRMVLQSSQENLSPSIVILQLPDDLTTLNQIYQKLWYAYDENKRLNGTENPITIKGLGRQDRKTLYLLVTEPNQGDQKSLKQKVLNYLGDPYKCQITVTAYDPQRMETIEDVLKEAH